MSLRDHLCRLATTVDHWSPEIAALIDTGDSNAKSEGINRVITLIARDAFGFRNPPTNAHAAAPPAEPADTSSPRRQLLHPGDHRRC
ncbi:transposase [Streptomyces bobili]|uniref:transposase n=1 Tax=Streptomyces bobili TaxID=67280 RepID=UPI00370FAB5A